MWINLPCDILANIFSFLSPDSLACAKSTCRSWYESGNYTTNPRRQIPPWFIAFPSRNRSHFCYAYNPEIRKWYCISLEFVHSPIRPISSIISGLILLRLNTSVDLQLAICNPFTQFIKHLPCTKAIRTNPAIGVTQIDQIYKVYVVGGMSEGGCYDLTVEMYDSVTDKWEIIGFTPLEFAVRITVWTPSECVYSDGVLYWLTSARAYSLMGFEIGTSSWREVSVPMANRLEFAALVRRNGKLTLLGGKCGGDAYVWELGDNEMRWDLVERVPFELGMMFLGGKGCWDGTKCASSEGFVCLYKDVGSGRLIWKKVSDTDSGSSKWEWFWIEGCGEIKGNQLRNCQIKGLLLHPNLAVSSLLNQ